MQEIETPRWRERVAASPWTKLVGKLGLYAAGFAALALVGSGRVLAWAPAPRPVKAAPTVSAALSAAPPRLPPKLAPPSASGVASTDAADGGVGGGSGADADAGVALPAVTPDGRVALNRATEADLRRLPGIGATRAKAILALRSRLGGRFKKVEDLLRVHGLGRKSLARLRPLVVVD